MPSQPEPGDVALGLDTVSLCCVAGQWAFTFIGWVVLATADAGHVDPGSDDYKDFSSLQFVMATAVTAWCVASTRCVCACVCSPPPTQALLHVAGSRQRGPFPRQQRGRLEHAVAAAARDPAPR